MESQAERTAPSGGLGVPGYRLYSPWQIFVAVGLCFLAGPVLVYSNLSRRKEHRSASVVFLAGGLAYAAILAAVLGRPNGNPVSWWVPTGVFIGMVRRPQRALYQAHLSAGGVRESWWKPIGVALLCVAGTAGVVLLGHLFLGWPVP